MKRRGAEVPTLVQSTALDAFHQKHSSKTQAGAKLAQESPQKLQIARSCIVRSLGPRWDRLSSSSITQTHVYEHFPFFEPLVALMRVHTFVTNSLYRQTTVGYWFSTFSTNSFSRRTVVQINLCPPHSVPCATRHANLPASTKPPRHRGDCAKGARQVFSQAATGRHPLQSSCNPRRAKHIKPQRFDWCLQSNGRARAWIRPWSLPAWTVSRVGHKQFSTVPNKKLPSQGFVPPNGAAASMSSAGHLWSDPRPTFRAFAILRSSSTEFSARASWSHSRPLVTALLRSFCNRISTALDDADDAVACSIRTDNPFSKWNSDHNAFTNVTGARLEPNSLHSEIPRHAYLFANS